MTAAIYTVSAVLVAALATRAWLLDREASARRAFLGLGVSLSITFLAFALAIAPGSGGLRALAALSGCLASAFLRRTVEALFPLAQAHRDTGPRWVVTGWLVGSAAAVAHLTSWVDVAQPSPAEVLSGLFAIAATGSAVQHLLGVRREAPLDATRIRVGWLVGATIAGALVTAVEGLVRLASSPVDVTGMSWWDRDLALHGPMPPFSPLLAAGVVYVLYQGLVAERLVALQEMASRVASVSLAALVLVAMHALTLQVVARSRFPLHWSFLLFLVSAMFLSVWGAARERLQRRMDRWLNPPGAALERAVAGLEGELPRLAGSDALARAIVSRIHGSGRFEHVAVWLYEPDKGAFRARASRGEGGGRAEVAAPPDVAASASEPWYDAREPSSGALAGWFDALAADLVLPFRTRDELLGWVALRETRGADGVSPEERERLHRLADAAALGLVQEERYRQLAEDRRLAALGAMSAGLAHEIRNPLAGLKGAAQVLQDHPDDDVAQDMLGILVTEAGRLDRVVRDFLVFARPSEVTFSPTDLEAVVRHAAGLMEAEGLPDRVSLTVSCAPVPEVDGDATRLGQVTLNLLRNAVEAVATRPEGGRVRVTLQRASEPGPARVELAVMDDGPGIPADLREQLFTPFFTTKAQGTGLGLAICRRLVDAHRGSLRVRSTPSEGTTFTVSLPVASAADPARGA